ncbi:MAG: hypothetical protein NHB32_28850 [Fischerella sp. CENA71]|nr:hypothetical protein [Fischerella sp. CENA71]
MCIRPIRYGSRRTKAAFGVAKVICYRYILPLIEPLSSMYVLPPPWRDRIAFPSYHF